MKRIAASGFLAHPVIQLARQAKLGKPSSFAVSDAQLSQIGTTVARVSSGPPRSARLPGVLRQLLPRRPVAQASPGRCLGRVL